MKIWSQLHGDMQERRLRISRSLVVIDYKQDPSEIPCRASSDPHEWRNELGAVSDRYSAKLQYL